MQNKIPIAHCPKYGWTILYSDNPHDKLTVIVRTADESYHGKTILCAKCKTMLAVIEKPKVVWEYVAIPLISQII